MRIRNLVAAPSLCAYVAARMREGDKKEFEAYGPRDARNTGENFSRMMLCRVIAKDVPIMVIGGTEFQPGVWWAAAYATDRFDEIKITATKVGIQLLNQAKDMGMRRCETRYLKENKTSADWLGLLGFEDEVKLPGYGINGEDFVQCALLQPLGH